MAKQAEKDTIFLPKGKVAGKEAAGKECQTGKETKEKEKGRGWRKEKERRGRQKEEEQEPEEDDTKGDVTPGGEAGEAEKGAKPADGGVAAAAEHGDNESAPMFPLSNTT